MDTEQRDFLDSLLETASPSGFEQPSQRTWIDFLSPYADEIRTDEYGNAIAVHEGGESSVALTGHADEIGFMVRDIDDAGYLRLTPIGGSDRTVSRGQHVQVHTDEGPISGVIGQTAIHIRDTDEDAIQDIDEQYVDIGVDERERAAELVERGDPITFKQTISELENERIAARGLDNRIGIWAVADGFRQAVAADPDSTVYAVSTVQEELGAKGATMVGFDLDPDVAIAVDVTHATDDPGAPITKESGVELGAGPVISRGSANHSRVVAAVRSIAKAAGIDVQLEATASGTGTDADAFYTTRGGTPSLNCSVPNRYMHTPVETLDLRDLAATADLLSEFALRAHEFDYSLDF